MTLVPPRPPRTLTLASGELLLPALLCLPVEQPPLGALLVCHGAGSCKENHLIMAEQAAERGLAAMVFDFRGHGAAGGSMDAAAIDDVHVAARTLLGESGAPWLAGRGSSLGAFLLLLAAHRCPGLFRSLALLCPADAASLLRGLDHFTELDASTDPDEPFHGRFDNASLRAFLARTDIYDAARNMPRVLLAHARDDEDVPFAVCERLAGLLAPPTRLIAVPRGGHKGPQRSPLVARATLDWVFEQA
jgi:pimeloyl-ACP methyl ester carboxylesterase